MPFSIATLAAKKVFWGTTEVKKIFSGATQVWSSGDPYIYVGTFGNKIRKYLKSDMSYVAESSSYGGAIASIYGDDTHLYVGGYSTNKVRKYLKSTLAYVSESATFALIQTIAGDDTHLYIGGGYILDASGYIVRKILKSNLSTVTDSSASVSSGEIQKIKLDATHVYLIGGGYLSRCLKSTLVLQNQINFRDPEGWAMENPYGLTVDDSNVFVSNLSPKILYKFNKSTLAYVSNLYSTFNDYIRDIQSDSSNVYAAMSGNYSRIYKFSKTTYLGQSPVYSDTTPAPGIYETVIEGDYIYAVGGTPFKVRAYNLSDLSLARESASAAVILTSVSL